MSRPRPIFGRPITEIADLPRDQSDKYAFVFSDNINDWFGRVGKKSEKQALRRKTLQNEKAKRILSSGNE